MIFINKASKHPDMNTINDHLDNHMDNQELMERLIKITDDTDDMRNILKVINKEVKSFKLPSFMDETFVSSIVESDITNNIEFFKITSQNNTKIVVLIDRLNDLYLPFNFFTSIVIPMYMNIQLRTAFSELSSIREILNEIASSLQDEIERITLAVSEEEFKDAKFNKKDISEKDVNDILTANTVSKKQSEPLEECPLCGEEKVTHYYECVKCQYKYCTKCCEEIASRQALCPCCREELSLTEHY